MVFYTYNLTVATNLYDNVYSIEPDSYNIVAVRQDVGFIDRRISNKLPVDCIQAICEIVQTVKLDKPFHIRRDDPNNPKIEIQHKLTHSICVVSAQKCKRVFVSQHKGIKDATGSQGFRIKQTIMLTFDENNRLLQTVDAVREIVTLLTNFRIDDPDLIWIQRRIYAMQQLNHCPHFPFNFDMVYYRGKRGPKVKIFQEKAHCDLLTYHNEIRKLDTLSEQVKQRFCNELVSALSYLENFGLTHRDIKLENILVFIEDGQLHVKLSDLGFVCLLNDVEALRQLMGSASWAAPEVHLKAEGKGDGNRLGIAADVWSLGLVLYILVKGEPAPIQRCRIMIEKLKKKLAITRKAIQLIEQSNLTVAQAEKLKNYLVSLRELKPTKMLPSMKPQLLALLKDDLALDDILLKNRYDGWSRLVKSLPASPRTLQKIEDLSTAMLQDQPDARINLSKALQVARAMDKDAPPDIALPSC